MTVFSAFRRMLHCSGVAGCPRVAYISCSGWTTSVRFSRTVPLA
ncbi:hypothetical protein [Kribbella sp. NPDC003557]